MPLARDLPTLQHFKASQPRPADAIMKGMAMENELSRIGITQGRNDIAQDRNAIAREGQGLQKEQFEQNKQQAALANGLRFLASAPKEEYGKIKEWLSGFDIPVDLLPKDVTDETWPKVLGQITQGVGYGVENGLAKLKENIKIAEDERKQKNAIELKKIPPGKAPKDVTDITTWVNPVNPKERVNLPKGQMPPAGYVKISDTKKGQRLTVGPDGAVTWEQGGSDLTVKTKGTIEDKILAGVESYNRVTKIKKEFKPEYQEIGFRLQKAWTGLAARMGQDVLPEDRKSLIEFKAYQRKSIENINLYIKEMTGAQMSEKEADRLRLAQPDPGEKWYSGDDPITFEAKVDDVIKAQRAAIARFSYYKSKNITNEAIVELINSDQAIDLNDIISQIGN
jgi:hypothetical protein